MTTTTTSTTTSTSATSTQSGVTLGRFAAKLGINAVFGLIIAVYFGGMNSLTGDVDISNGFDKVGLIFGGADSMATTLIAIMALVWLIYAAYAASKKGKHKFVIAYVTVAMFAALFFSSWINFSWNMLAPFAAVSFVAAQTWLSTHNFKK